jgi:hypothetical protein
MLIFGNMADAGEEKLAIVLECMDIDNPRSPREYMASLMTWDEQELIEYLKRRKREQADCETTRFRPHP